MSSVKSTCTKCGVSLLFAASSLGKAVRCPKCNFVFTASAPDNGVTPAATTPTTVTPARHASAPAPSVMPDPAKQRPAAASASAPQPGNTRKQRYNPASRTRSLWIIGGAVLALFILIGGGITTALLLRGSKKDEPRQAAAETPQKKTERPPARPNPESGRPNPGPQPDKQPPQPDKQPEQPKIGDGDVTEADVPPLPPLKDRPMLVLDPGGHNSQVRATLFTPDGQRLVTVSWDKTVRVWDTTTGEMLRVVRLPIGAGREGLLNAAALTPDGRCLAVGGLSVAGMNGAPIFLLDLDAGQVMGVLYGHRDNLASLSFSPNGRQLASSAMDGTVLVHTLGPAAAAQAAPTVLRGHTDFVSTVAFSPDGKTVATASNDGSARIWLLNAPSGPNNPRILRTEGLGCNTVAWNHDGSVLAIGGGVDGHLRLFSKDGQLLKDFEKGGSTGPNEVTQLISVTFSRDDKEILYTGVGRTGRAGILDAATGKHRIEFNEHNNTVITGRFSPDGLLAATTGGDDSETYLWKVADGTVVHKLVGAGRTIWGVGWSRDGKSIAWGNINRGDTTKGLTPLEHAFRLDDLEFADNSDAAFQRCRLQAGGTSIAAIDFFTLSLKQAGADDRALRSPYKDERIYCMTLLPKNRLVMGGGNRLTLIDLGSGKMLREFRGHTGIVLSVAPSPDGNYFVTGSTDKTLCVWSPERDEPLLTIFVAGPDWIAWTPEGYYACSACGERLMGWQKNNGLEAVASFFPAAQFRPSLYHPAALKLLLPSGSLAKALARAAKGRPVAGVNVTQVLPPEVTMTLPPEVAKGQVEGARLEVKATAKSVGRNPVIGMRLLLDGRPYLGRKGIHAFANPKLGAVEAAWTVALPPGKHVLAVQAETAVSKGVSAVAEVTRTGGDKEKPNLYILAVGVSAYPGKLRLRYGASDAELITHTFQERSRTTFGRIEVKLLTDRDATKRGILEGMEWLSAHMTPLDVGIVFFSGHGTRDADGNFFLVPIDVSARDKAGTCVNGEVVKAALADMPGRLIAILDCCHSGSVAESFQPARADNLVRDLVTEDYGVVVLCSSLGQEYSLESDATQGGFFTRSLVEGLSGKADFNHDKIIHIHELDIYAAIRVRELSHGQQTPLTGRPPTIRSFPLAQEGR